MDCWKICFLLVIHGRFRSFSKCRFIQESGAYNLGGGASRWKKALVINEISKIDKILYLFMHKVETNKQFVMCRISWYFFTNVKIK